jgi:hypothetical protein
MRAILCSALMTLAITTAGAEDVAFWHKQGANIVEF